MDTLGTVGGEDLEYQLIVIQGPQRGRMCGFGDRDRRPISPPTIIKLEARQPQTNTVVPVDNLDISFFVVSADLWSEDGSKEVNYVTHPAFAAASGSSNASAAGREEVATASTSSGSATVEPLGQPQADYVRYARDKDRDFPHSGRMPNLIGSLHANAFRLQDLEGNPGIFFIFHDVSVRTEGRYRLRFLLFNVGAERVNQTGSAPALRVAYSEPFDVYAAKKFPGMLEPTAISKHFAKQGVRIPTRKGTTRRRGDAGGSDDEED